MQEVISRMPRSVLDVGAGNGEWLAGLAETLPGSMLVGIDLASPTNRPTPVRFIQADAAQLPIADRSLGTVAARAVLHHMDSPAATTAELARLLATGGVLVVRDATSMRPTQAQELHDYLVARGHPPEPHAGVDPDEIADAAREAGLVVDALDRNAGTAMLAGPRFSTPAFQLVARRP